MVETSWHNDIFFALKERGIRLVAHVPDAGHGPLLSMCADAPDLTLVGLTAEQDGVGLLCGAWAGGSNGVLLMQSSGVGNIVNALSLSLACRIPFLTIVSMRGEWDEFVPWQVPMGQGAPRVLEAMGVVLFRVEDPEQVGSTVKAAAGLAFNTRQAVAVLLSQKLIGAKRFSAELD